jgi:predicted nucleic acid-binding protein
LVDAERGGGVLAEVIDDGDDVAVAAITVAEYVRRAGAPRGAHDLIIAATARARERQVVSLDQSGFAELPDVLLSGPDALSARGFHHRAERFQRGDVDL